MRQNRAKATLAVLIACTAVAAILVNLFDLPPRIEPAVHSAIGREMAKEALRLMLPGGQIIVITRDTSAFKQPASQIQLQSFSREIRNAHTSIARTQVIQLDPLRPVEVPSGDFYELLRRAQAQDVIVSFMGPPLLTEEQRSALGSIKPRIVAFCSGSLSEQVDLQKLFQGGLLHAAIVNRPADSSPFSSSGIPDTFEQLYMTVTSGSFSNALPSTAAAF